MKDENSKRVPTVFGPERAFNIKPTLGGPAPPGSEAEFKSLAEHLLREKLALDPRKAKPVNRAASLAGVLAKNTGFPLLVFPVLFEEALAEELAREQRLENGQALERAILVAGLLLTFVIVNLLSSGSNRWGKPANQRHMRVVLAPAIQPSPAPTPPLSSVDVR